MVTSNVVIFKLLYNKLFELSFDTLIVEHSGIPNYTKLAFNSLK